MTDNIIKKENLDSCVLLVVAPGVAPNELKVSADTETSTLYVSATPEVPKEFENELELDLSLTISVDAKYNVSRAAVVVSDGIVLITLPVNSERIITVHPTGE